MTPALAGANNGNWQTASRWGRMLGRDYRVRVLPQWDGRRDDLMVALHARRSAPSIADWAAQADAPPLVVVLTGTDLYRDIRRDEAAQRSLALADRLVVLHEAAIGDVPAAYRAKARVCLQSCPRRRALAKPAHRLRALMVGHLREEKDPRTYLAAAQLLRDRTDIWLDHVGGPLDPGLAAEAAALAASHPRYRWLGALDHASTRDRIQRAHVLVHASRMEGGAHVVIEAIRSGTPVLASRIPGNIGLLGLDYDGYFEPGDAAGLAARLLQLRDDGAMLAHLAAQCLAREPLFDPAREQATLTGLLSDLMTHRHDPPGQTP